MKVLVIGGTLFFGVHMVNEFLEQGDEVTIATRGLKEDIFGDRVNRIVLDRLDYQSVKKALRGKYFDLVCDNICYSSNELKSVLEIVACDRYILTSTGSVYETPTLNTSEEKFDPFNHELKWCDRKDYVYGKVKQQAETALFKYYHDQKAAAVRFPYVIGVDDYTKRLHFYVEHIINQIPMNVNNFESYIPFIKSDVAGKFIVFLAKSDYRGPINANGGVIQIKDIISYIEEKTGKKAVYDNHAESASYNNVLSFSLSNKKANEIGFEFEPIEDWFYHLLDELILEMIG